jgi:hypothetical protein
MTTQKTITEDKSSPRPSFIYNFSFSIVLSIIFSLIFTAVYFIWKDAAIESTKLLAPNILKYFIDYWIYSWLLIWIISFLEIAVILFLRLILWLRRFKITLPIIYAIVFSLWAFFWYTLLYVEQRNTPAAIAIIDFFWKPFLYSWLVMAIFAWIWFLILLAKKFIKK